MTQPIARNRYDERPDPGIACKQNVTKQSFRDECDINKILDRIARGGPMPDRPIPQYGDFTNIPDFVLAHSIVQRAQESFYRLDPKIRVKFNNDPGAFLAFAQDAKNIDQMVEMGLVTRKPLTEPVKSDSEPKEAPSSVPPTT